jgi:Rha family phage regulatory protein
LCVFHRLEARREIRGSRFVAGFSGEQFALPDAIGSLRDVRRRPASGEFVSLSDADPPNLAGVLIPGTRLPPLTEPRVVRRIDALFEIERSINGKSPAERLAVRQINSQQIAAHLEKRHDNVLQSIDSLLIDKETPPDFYHLRSYIDAQNGQVYRSYNMTRDGATLLCMGFIGTRAHQFKLAFLKAFNDMEGTIKQQHVKKLAPVRMSGALTRELRLAMDTLPNALQLSPASKQAFAAALYAPLGIEVQAPQVERTWSTTELADA